MISGRNKVEVLMLLMVHPSYDLVCFTLEPSNFTLNVFWDFVFIYNGNIHATMNF